MHVIGKPCVLYFPCPANKRVPRRMDFTWPEAESTEVVGYSPRGHKTAVMKMTASLNHANPDPTAMEVLRTVGSKDTMIQ